MKQLTLFIILEFFLTNSFCQNISKIYVDMARSKNILAYMLDNAKKNEKIVIIDTLTNDFYSVYYNKCGNATKWRIRNEDKISLMELYTIDCNLVYKFVEFEKNNIKKLIYYNIDTMGNRINDNEYKHKAYCGIYFQSFYINKVDSQNESICFEKIGDQCYTFDFFEYNFDSLEQPISEYVYDTSSNMICYYEYYDNRVLKTKGYFNYGLIIENSCKSEILYFSKSDLCIFKGYYQTGLWVEYYINGILKSKGTYVNNNKVGFWYYYSKDGKLINEEYCK